MELHSTGRLATDNRSSAALLALILSSLVFAGLVEAGQRSVSYTYNALGLVETIDGPRTDVADITTYGYDAQGRLSSVSNALNQVTTLGNFDALDNPQTITDANGVVSSLTYTPQGWLSTVTRGGFTTTYAYNAVGDITQLTQGDGSFLTYTWDDARRLIAVSNNLGDTLEYDLDAMGNRTAQRLKDSGGVLTQQHHWVYDELGRLLSSVGAAGQNASHQYDLNDNPTVMATPLNQRSTRAYDALDRLMQNTDPLKGVTDLEYDAQDNLTQVRDPRGVTTQYQYDGLGNLTQQVSPDSGTSTFEHDAAGNVTKKTDARGVVTTYSYDALNRITAKRFPANSALDITYAYDMTTNGNKGIGHLTALLDSSGLIDFSYDARGHLVKQTRSVKVNNVERIEGLAYSYDGAGRLSGIGYPGFAVTYPRNAGGQVTGVSLTVAGQATTSIASNISYLPFGPLKSLTWGNGIQLTRHYDQDYQLTQQNVGSWQNTYSVDANGNIKGNSHSLFGPANYNYDALDRLTQEQTNTRRKTYAYDAAGNRKSIYIYAITDGKETLGYARSLTYATNSNRMSKEGNYSIVMDATGNALQRSDSRVHVYDQQGRLGQVLNPTELYADFRYNALGQRTVKRAYLSNGALDFTITHLYGPDGQLLGQVRYTSLGKKFSAQYWVWLDGIPLAQIDFRFSTSSGAVISTNKYYLHSDHLNAPRLATNQAQTLVWSWESDAFGVGAPNGDVDGDNVVVDIPLRFPGQIFETYSHLYYNYFRDYDPYTGRYVQSDPIGLGGGVNTYGYVEGSPLSKADLYGLASCTFTLSSGRITCTPSNPQSSPVNIPAASGNNGENMQCRNNPNCTSIPFRGPIPLGCWVWTTEYTAKPNGRVLKPCPETGTNVVEGRTEIRSHSCPYPFGPGTVSPYCSEGCVTGTVPAIQTLNFLIDSEPGSTLQVVP